MFRTSENFVNMHTSETALNPLLGYQSAALLSKPFAVLVNERAKIIISRNPSKGFCI